MRTDSLGALCVPLSSSPATPASVSIRAARSKSSRLASDRQHSVFGTPDLRYFAWFFFDNMFTDGRGYVEFTLSNISINDLSC